MLELKKQKCYKGKWEKRIADKETGRRKGIIKIQSQHLQKHHMFGMHEAMTF